MARESYRKSKLEAGQTIEVTNGPEGVGHSSHTIGGVHRSASNIASDLVTGSGITGGRGQTALLTLDHTTVRKRFSDRLVTARHGSHCNKSSKSEAKSHG
jgi:hypothetical protein